jgi:hypothetical protein
MLSVGHFVWPVLNLVSGIQIVNQRLQLIDIRNPLSIVGHAIWFVQQDQKFNILFRLSDADV